MILILALIGSLFWGMWILLETWKGSAARLVTLVVLGCAGGIVVSRLAGWRPPVELYGSSWLLFWIPSLAGFLIGRRLGRRAPPGPRLDWIEGPVEAVAALARLAAGSWRRRRRRGDPVAGEIQRREAVEQVLDLGKSSVGEIMVSRSEMDALDAEAAVSQWIRLVVTKRRSHLPVYRGNLDQVAGIVSIQNLLRTRAPEERVGDYVRPVAFVPESVKCDALLRQMWRAGEKVAVVIDEYGGVAGFVTNVDLLEILVGDLLEEPESHGARMIRVEDHVWLADAHFRVADVNERFGLGLPEGAYETLAGLFLERLGRIPQVGERISTADVELEVVGRDDRRVRQIRLRLRGHPPGERRRPASRQGRFAR